MSLVGLDPIGTTGSSAATPKTNILGKDDFLKLLTTQLKHQDPLNPMEGTEFTAQLSQFSSLEQLNNINDSIEQLTTSQTSMQNAQAVALIGKTVRAAGNVMDHSEGTPQEIHFNLDGDAADLLINIYDATDSVVKTITVGARSAGEQSVVWDGRGHDGSQLPSGRYIYEIAAVDGDQLPVGAQPFATGLVKGITYENGRAYVLTESQSFPVDTVVHVYQGAAATP